MPLKKEISLLPDEENPNSLSSRLFKWLITIGRYIIVFTELIVVTAFISRFWLDRKNSDLSEVIRQQEAVLESTQKFEKEFVALQKKLSLLREYYSKESDYVYSLNSLISSVQPDVVFEKINFKQAPDTNRLTANANLIAYTEDSIVNFLTNLMLNPDMETVNINRIEKRAKDNKYSISVELVFKENKKTT